MPEEREIMMNATELERECHKAFEDILDFLDLDKNYIDYAQCITYIVRVVRKDRRGSRAEDK